MTQTLAPTPWLSDDHTVLLWQACAYADDVADAVRDGRHAFGAYDAMLEFLHYRLLPYLRAEERRLPDAQLRDERLRNLLLVDHDRLREDVENIEGCHTRDVLVLSADALVHRLDRHVRREEAWVADEGSMLVDEMVESWALPLLFGDEIDLDTLPEDSRDRLALQRLMWMRPGEVVHLESTKDLHPLWRRQHSCSPASLAWAYELEGPPRWRVRITRRTVEDG